MTTQNNTSPSPADDREKVLNIITASSRIIEKLALALFAIKDSSDAESRWIAEKTLTECAEMCISAKPKPKPHPRPRFELAIQLQKSNRNLKFDERYWVCECDLQFIHRRDRHRRCGHCNAFGPNQADSYSVNLAPLSAKCSCMADPSVAVAADSGNVSEKDAAKEEKTYAAAA